MVWQPNQKDQSQAGTNTWIPSYPKPRVSSPQLPDMLVQSSALTLPTWQEHSLMALLAGSMNGRFQQVFTEPDRSQ